MGVTNNSKLSFKRHLLQAEKKGGKKSLGFGFSKKLFVTQITKFYF